ncbi:hypothetical protein [Rhodohalobacter halophilus]|uniref:hypothetical protein n=1 Tax=Rhodohalobacter halophilus TaxID=1812810 RepID=UPI00083F7BD2|nr:hypothetical protein [Rhodohalobacter halophilus]
MKKILLFLFISLSISSVVIAQNDSASVLDGMKDRFKSEELNVIMLLQSTAAFSFQDDDFNGGREFGIGAPLLDFKGSLPNNYMYRLQLQLNRTPSILDAQVGYRFSEMFRLIAGANKPFMVLELDPSPASTDMINRARVVGAMVNARETGLTFLGDFDGIYYRAGIYNGTGFSQSNDNRFLYTGRLGFRNETFDTGINASLNRTRGESVGNTQLISAGDRSIYGAYIKYSGDQFFGTAEFLQSRFDLFTTTVEETITGYYVTAGIHATESDDFLIRLDHLSFDVSGNEDSDRLVFGWNRQINELVSFQLNGLYQINDVTDNQAGVSANFQFYF